MSTFLSATRAAERLGISRATLYSYVSRGLVRSRSVPGRRAREYAREDIERLAAQARGRRDPLSAAEHALEFDGLPVLSSALSLIDGGRLYYRGRDVLELCSASTFEDVAALLWGGPCEVPEPLPAPAAGVRRALAKLDFAAACIAHLAALPACSPAQAGGRILAELVAVASGFASVPEVSRGSVAARLSHALGVPGARVERAMSAALILCADHELNASAFAARVVAGAGATPFMAVIGALGALSGPRHGGATAQVASLFSEASEPSDSIARALSAGSLTGFQHPLYPDGDPRGRRLLELCPKGPERRRAEALAAAANAAGLHPSVDFGLVALSRCLGLPEHAPFVLFAIGRSAGWLGHILEQYATGALIRPRARYVGAAPHAESMPPPRPATGWRRSTPFAKSKSQ